ncbi:MAG: hypothetical protein RLZZ262_1405 [Bacteroidota bacterium]
MLRMIMESITIPILRQQPSSITHKNPILHLNGAVVVLSEMVNSGGETISNACMDIYLLYQLGDKRVKEAPQYQFNEIDNADEYT